ncbi:phosphatase PAP2 family protein [Bacillus solimangrovi]|uniref:Phosphatidic acid phosphatase type 2/haloperoxidase domain-containing protein n=1 Tax=Bacillus solimangrovi TaxID=1305675 RepID=A0A1E5LJZ7_9BACI|nr:phosphatase PAP2 family protein [Bacillus solimangrovi]OEH94404.1 hypothetical protein BFG57_08050 [Bacillus solimangrovi]
MEINERKSSRGKLPAIFHIGIIILCAVLVIIFLYLSKMIQRTEVSNLDFVIRNVLVLENESIVYKIFEVITWFGSTSGIITLLVIMLFLLIGKYRDYLGSIIFVLMVLLSKLLNDVLKELFQRERPPLNHSLQELDFSFPSGGALIGLVAYGLATYLLLNKRTLLKEKYMIGISGVTFILLIGISRVVLSAHYPTDVMAGHAMGGILLILAIYSYNLLSKIFKRREN